MMFTKRVWSPSPTREHGTWSEQEIVDRAECLRVVELTKLHPDVEMARLDAGKVVNCGIITLRGHLSA